MTRHSDNTHDLEETASLTYIQNNKNMNILNTAEHLS